MPLSVTKSSSMTADRIGPCRSNGSGNSTAADSLLLEQMLRVMRYRILRMDSKPFGVSCPAVLR